ncbi:MAG: hypothetical protein J6X60_01930, partial [Ruminiclostridium sp.]|nr:hypothetical protein [Ruminiclostridium sp.]
MNLSDAKAIRDRLSGRDIPSDEDFFYYTEAMEYLIEKDPNPHYMLELGAQYRYRKYFDLELKYYEMAASYGDETAMCGLGNFWYYGRNGIPD